MNRDAWEVFINDVSVGIFFDFEFVTYIVSHIINSNRDGRVHLTIAKCGMELIHNEQDENDEDPEEKEESISAETYPDYPEKFKEFLEEIKDDQNREKCEKVADEMINKMINTYEEYGTEC